MISSPPEVAGGRQRTSQPVFAVRNVGDPWRPITDWTIFLGLADAAMGF